MANPSNPQGKVLAVIPNYNGGDLVLKCLDSVKNQTYGNMEIVVVDNDSKDGSYEKIQNRFPEIRVIQSGYNAGWGVACNTGMRASESDYILLLNNDALMDPRCTEEMVKAIGKNPRYGSCASRIMLSDEPEKVEVCGLVIYRDGSSCGRGRLGKADSYMTEEEVFCANDCCCLYRREMIQDIGDYDPDFFIYCDETEMGWRHQLAGWKCIYTPSAVAYHAHSRAAGSYSPFKAFYVERNRLYLCMKYFSWARLIESFFFSMARYGTQWYLATFKQKGALAYYRKNYSILSGLGLLIFAHWAALLKSPAMFHRRNELKKIRRISEHDIAELFERYGITTRQMAGYE